MPEKVAAVPSLLYLVKRLELVIRSHLDEILRDSGVTTPQYTALTVLAHRGAASAAQLARDSFVSPQSIADLLRQLERRGLISREPNPHSKRELLIRISDAGKDFLDEYAAPIAEVERLMIANLSPTEVSHLRGMLLAGWSALLPGASRSIP
ncbi:MarR family transcriptional regulator [Nocardia sp. NPDC005366]|uniref:MarR family winged helix-turn-helix transcriptional regulator n=1 Tax=Nocardia sp. NPDC005366 TaxID=3156878 RepID=UPI0033B970D9